MFKDKTYEQLDDLSKLVEPFEYSVNDELVKFPDRLQITADMLQSHMVAFGNLRLTVDQLVSNKALELGLNSIYRQSSSLMKEFFVLEAEDPDADIFYDFENNTLSSPIYLVKVKQAYDDMELEKMALKILSYDLVANLRYVKSFSKARLNEIADLYGSTEVKSKKSKSGKLATFSKHMEYLVSERKLNIRDISLCRKLMGWIVKYVVDGNLPALNNLTKVKIMMHNNLPIYSIEEVK